MPVGSSRSQQNIHCLRRNFNHSGSSRDGFNGLMQQLQSQTFHQLEPTTWGLANQCLLNILDRYLWIFVSTFQFDQQVPSEDKAGPSNSYHGGSSLDNTRVVSTTAQAIGRKNDAPPSKHMVVPPVESNAHPSVARMLDSFCSKTLRQNTEATGLEPNVISHMAMSVHFVTMQQNLTGF